MNTADCLALTCAWKAEGERCSQLLGTTISAPRLWHRARLTRQRVRCVQPCCCQKPAAHRAEGRSCRELHFFCTLREASASPHPQRGRPRWPAKNTSVRWKPESNEITSESFVLPKYLQCCCSADGWLFPFPTSYSF